MICDSLECHSKAVATSTISSSNYCIECAIKITKQHGPGVMVTIPESPFPWEADIDGTCPHCGVSYSNYLLGMTNECPKCRRDIE